MPTKVPFVDLDAMLTPEECGEWFGMHPQEVLRNPLIPKCKMGHRTVRFHPRTVIEKLTGTKLQVTPFKKAA